MIHLMTHTYSKGHFESRSDSNSARAGFMPHCTYRPAVFPFCLNKAHVYKSLEPEMSSLNYKTTVQNTAQFWLQ